MPKLLSGFIANQLAKHLGKQVKAATLIKLTNANRTAGAVSGGLNPTEASYAARGWIEEYDAKYIDDAKHIDKTTVRVDDRRISLLGSTIASGQVPAANDKISIEDWIYRVLSVDRDPDSAVYTCHARKHGQASPWSSGFSSGFGG